MRLEKKTKQGWKRLDAGLEGVYKQLFYMKHIDKMLKDCILTVTNAEQKTSTNGGKSFSFVEVS